MNSKKLFYAFSLMALMCFVMSCSKDDEPEVNENTLKNYTPYDWEIDKSIYFIENSDTSLVRQWTEYMYQTKYVDVQRAKEKFQAQSNDNYKYYFKATRMM